MKAAVKVAAVRVVETAVVRVLWAAARGAVVRAVETAAARELSVVRGAARGAAAREAAREAVGAAMGGSYRHGPGSRIRTRVD